MRHMISVALLLVVGMGYYYDRTGRIVGRVNQNQSGGLYFYNATGKYLGSSSPRRGGGFYYRGPTGQYKGFGPTPR